MATCGHGGCRPWQGLWRSILSGRRSRCPPSRARPRVQAAKPGKRAFKEGDRVILPEAGQDLDKGQPRGIVDGHIQVLVSRAMSACGCPPYSDSVLNAHPPLSDLGMLLINNSCPCLDSDVSRLRDIGICKGNACDKRRGEGSSN